jgi:hypothetical protein
MGRKPSLTKQIAEALKTENKKEQLDRIEGLKKAAQTPSAVVTVLFARGNVQLNTLSTNNMTPDDVKFILQKGIDEVTTQVLKFELEKKQELDEIEDGLELPDSA